MRKMSERTLPAATSLTLMCFLGLQGCASTSAPAPAETPSISPASKSAVVSKDMITVENLLRWPLEGRPAGTDKVVMALQKTYKMAPVRDGYRAEGPAVLADNHVLSFASVRKLTGAIHLGLREEPCYPSEQAAALIGATADPTISDIHGVDRGKTFEATKNGVMVYFDTTPVTYRCVTSIHIRTR